MFAASPIELNVNAPHACHDTRQLRVYGTKASHHILDESH